MMDFIDTNLFPSLLTQFLVTTLFSFIIGLELHSYRRANEQDLGFGTTRTFALIGISGFVMYEIDESLVLYLCGLLVLASLLAVYYFHRAANKNYSLISPLLALQTYLIAPILIRFPDWFSVLYVVSVLMMLAIKPEIRRFSDAFRNAEMVTFSKFLIMVGVILPLLPDRQIAPFVTVTYYQVWTALLVVSSLSYLSYLVQTYLFKDKGLLLTGILGGLYSSTATTIVLSRRAAQMAPTPQVTQAIILATAMMYIRLLLLLFFLGHIHETQQLLIPFLMLIGSSLIVTWFVSRISAETQHETIDQPVNHPLEFRTALVFSLLFVFFSAATSFVLSNYGAGGLGVLSFVVGLTDIDPFILSLLQGTYQVDEMHVLAAIVIASGSNNLIKACYALIFCLNRFTIIASAWLVFMFMVSIIYILQLL